MRSVLPLRVVDLSCVSLKCFADLFSSVFDFSRDKQYFLLLVESALYNLSLEAICNLKKQSPDRLFFYLDRVSVSEMKEYTDQALQRCLQILKTCGKRLSPSGFLVAIDTSDLEYYGERDEYVHNYVKRMGKVYKPILVRRYATLSVVAPHFKLCLAILPVKKSDRLEDLVDTLLTSVKGLKIRCVVLDKGFYNAQVLNKIDTHGLHYLLPVVKRPDLNCLYWVSNTTGKWAWNYTIAAGKPWKTRATVHFHELRMGDYIGFVTNRTMKTDNATRLIRLYEQRWNIENGYKESQDYQIRTTSKNHAYRLLIYTISHLIVNLQNIIRETRYRVNYYEMTEIIKHILHPTTNNNKKRIHNITKRLTITL
jgi:hypothetical protein